MLSLRSASKAGHVPFALIAISVLYWLCKAPWSSNSANLSWSRKINSDGVYSLQTPSSVSQRHPNTASDYDSMIVPSGGIFDGVKEVLLGVSKPASASFPKTIWQTSSEAGQVKYSDKAETWRTLAGYKYNFLSDNDATRFVHENFASQRSIVKFWDDLSTVVLRADLLRYLIMLSKGGIYSDIDTSCLKHPDHWIPSHMDSRSINAIIGIEYDDTTYPLFIRPISFCQWTLMAKPNHPIFTTAVQRVMSNLELLARRQRAELSNLTIAKNEVLAATGPGMISDVVMQVLRDQGQVISWQTFHNMTTPTLFGDVLILPINGFAGAQKHSHAGNPAYGDKLVQHHFGRSWYKPPEPKKTENKPPGGKLVSEAGTIKSKIGQSVQAEKPVAMLAMSTGMSSSTSAVIPAMTNSVSVQQNIDENVEQDSIDIE